MQCLKRVQMPDAFSLGTQGQLAFLIRLGCPYLGVQATAGAQGPRLLHPGLACLMVDSWLGCRLKVGRGRKGGDFISFRALAVGSQEGRLSLI
jgi:hypothetical protein